MIDFAAVAKFPIPLWAPAQEISNSSCRLPSLWISEFIKIKKWDLIYHACWRDRFSATPSVLGHEPISFQ